MQRKVAYRGSTFTIAFAKEKSGACPAGEFFDRLSQLDQVKLMALFLIAGDHGKFYNPEKFGDLGRGLFEFKSFQIRMPFAYARNERGLILITHGFMKRKDKTPRKEITRAWRIFEEDQAQSELVRIRNVKR
jgi:phage-related protein